MTNIDIAAKFLRNRFIPRKISYKLWKYICETNSNNKFFFPINLNNHSLIYGGVCRISSDALFFNPQEYEKNIIHIYEFLLKRDNKSVFIDVGANNGQSLLLIKSIDNQTETHCFEPFSSLTDLLNNLCKKNKWESTVKINNFLLGDFEGMRNLYFCDGSTDTASTVQGFQSIYNTSIPIKQITLDRYINQYNISNVSIIKIDVEGGELEVLKGAKYTLQTMKPHIIIELLYTENEEHLCRQKTLINLLKNFGYRFHQIQEYGSLCFQDDVQPDPSYSYLNYLVTCDASI
ncbi:MAG: FkbM family methyltransferase [Calothrix sp. MO_167.B12]|nr:FkbM family methyltransferase [Calothrix sp. MO_167.B12]